MSWTPQQAQVPREAEIKLLNALLDQSNLSHYGLKKHYNVSPSVSNLWLPRFIKFGLAVMNTSQTGNRIRYNFSLTPQGVVWAQRRIDEYQMEQALRSPSS